MGAGAGRWATVVGLVATLVLAGSAPATAGPLADGAPGSTLTVAIKPLDPFVTRDGDRYRGFSIDLWNEVARRNGWQTTYRWYDTLPPLLADVALGIDDVGVAGITITKDREQRFDFSYPMFNAGLQVMTRPRASSSWTRELRSFATAGVARYLLALVAALVIAGHVIWIATRRRTGQGYLPGVGLGIYRAAGLGLVGDYGVGSPERPLARAAAVVWSIMGICFVSLFTAALASQLTVRSIESTIGGVQDLTGSKVVTVAGSSAAAYLRAHAIAFSEVPTIDDAYPQLDSGQVDAIVFDAPVLRHRVKVTGTSTEVLAGGVFAREDYGIAVPTGSPLRKKINTTLLDISADGTYQELYARYFGDEGTG